MRLFELFGKKPEILLPRAWYCMLFFVHELPPPSSIFTVKKDVVYWRRWYDSHMWYSGLSSIMALRISHYHMAGLFFALGPADGHLQEISKAFYPQLSSSRSSLCLEFHTTSGVTGYGDQDRLGKSDRESRVHVNQHIISAHSLQFISSSALKNMHHVPKLKTFSVRDL